MQTQNYEIDMTGGSLAKNILKFSLPLIATNILQLLYNAADVIVVGKFVGTQALAAVGSTASLITLFVNFFMGLSVGVTVAVSKFYGAREFESLQNIVHTAVMSSIIFGIISFIAGEALAKQMLQIIQTPKDVISGAELYMKFYFIGIPASLVFNFSAAVLRAVGDTRRPLYILTFSGIVNVLLNLLLVIVFKLGVIGVAAATSVSNFISAAMVIVCLNKTDGMYKIHLKKLKIHAGALKEIFIVGIPAGVQGTIFNVSNVVIQSAINTFGTQVVAGSTAGANIEGFVYMSMNAVYQAELTAVGQNYGAKNKKRIYKSLYIGILTVVAVGLIMGGGAYIFKRPLLSLYTDDAGAVSYGELRMMIICLTYALCGIMDVECGYLRGIGYSAMTAIVSFIGVCGIRLMWIYTVFASYRTLNILFMSWPVSWVATLLIHTIVIVTIGRKKLNRDLAATDDN